MCLLCLLFSSLWGVGYMPLSAPCDHIMAIVNHSDNAWSFIVTAYPALWIVFANHCQLANNMPCLVQHLWTNCMFDVHLLMMLLCQWILLVHAYLMLHILFHLCTCLSLSDLPGFFACVIILSFTCVLMLLTPSMMSAHTWTVMIMIIISQFPIFLVYSSSDLKES